MSDATTLVTAGILVKDGQVLLSRRPPGDRLAGLWELPGGKLEVGKRSCDHPRIRRPR